MSSSSKLRQIAAIVVFALTGQGLCPKARADQLSLTVQAGDYKIVDLPDGQQRILMQDFGQLLVPGAPQLPARTFLVAIPPDAVVRDVRLEAAREIELPGTYRIRPAPVASPLSQRADIDARCAAEWKQNYISSYGKDVLSPANPGRFEGTGALRKYRFVRIAYFPLAFAPATGKLTFRPSLSVTVDYDLLPAVGHAEAALSDTKAEATAARLLVNYTEAERWYAPHHVGLPARVTHDYVIIAPDALTMAVGSLVEWKRAIGYDVSVVTTSWISATYTGGDLAEQIRNFLIDTYLEWGIEYVLIAGNIDVVPMRQCFPDPANHGVDQWFCPPTDYYYADLTGNWDADGDGWFGEFGQDSVDFIPEVYVGRIPWSDAGTLSDICAKLVAFEADTGPWKSQALLVGTPANYANQDHTGYPIMDFAVLMEKMITDMLDGWTFTTMYETEGLVPSVYPCDIPITSDNFIGEWASGAYGIVNWGGHGSPVAAARLVWSRDDGDGVPESDLGELAAPYFVHKAWTPYLASTHPSISFHVSCNNAWPEVDNLARELIRNGTVGTLASTRVAWYAKGWDHETDGLVASHDYYFMRHLVVNGEKVGEALYNSKAYYATHFVFDHYRNWHNLFDYVLYGEPALVREGVAYACADSDGDGAPDPGQPPPACGLPDNCPDAANSSQADFDADGYGNACDNCPRLPVMGNPMIVTGDVNADAEVSSPDVICLVNGVFKGGPEPRPTALCGDTDCSGTLTSGDIIGLVNFLFKGGPAPCDVCALAPGE